MLLCGIGKRLSLLVICIVVPFFFFWNPPFVKKILFMPPATTSKDLMLLQKRRGQNQWTPSMPWKKVPMVSLLDLWGIGWNQTGAGTTCATVQRGQEEPVPTRATCVSTSCPWPFGEPQRVSYNIHQTLSNGTQTVSNGAQQRAQWHSCTHSWTRK